MSKHTPGPWLHSGPQSSVSFTDVQFADGTRMGRMATSVVHHIRASMDPVKELASAYHVSTTAIRKVLNRENWGWLK